MNYLVVPLCADSLSSCTEQGDALGAVDFQVMRLLYLDVRQGDISPIKSIGNLESHVEVLEDNFFYSPKSFAPHLDGYAQYD